MFVTNWISPTKIQKISEITNFFRHYFLSRTEVYMKKFRSLRNFSRIHCKTKNRQQVADDFKLLVPNSTLLILLFQFLYLFDR